MAVERLRTSYEEMDVDLFRGCLDDEFEYHYFDWYASEWLCWGLDFEDLCHDSLPCADHVEHIELPSPANPTRPGRVRSATRPSVS